MTLRIVQHRTWWLILSGLVLVPGLVFIALGGLRLSTDFTGGSLSQIRFAAGTRPAAAVMEEAAAAQNIEAPVVQFVDDDGMLVRLRELTEEEHQQFLSAVRERAPGAVEEAYSAVGPVIGQELQRRAVTAVIFVLLGIILYIAWAFRATSGSISGWAFGINAIIALVHDILITVGIFAFLGYTQHVEVDALFVTALLTILGFSVHDTIVVFDRVREGLRRNPSSDLTAIINASVNATLIRSINTSFTALLVLVALYLFGGSSIRLFVLALIVGIITGTYSSIFIASSMLPWWARRRR